MLKYAGWNTDTMSISENLSALRTHVFHVSWRQKIGRGYDRKNLPSPLNSCKLILFLTLVLREISRSKMRECPLANPLKKDYQVMETSESLYHRVPEPIVIRANRNTSCNTYNGHSISNRSPQ